MDINSAYKFAGPELVNAIREGYARWKLKKSTRNANSYVKLRLALHIKLHQWPDILKDLNEHFALGLCDEEVGQTFWDIKI